MGKYRGNWGLLIVLESNLSISSVIVHEAISGRTIGLIPIVLLLISLYLAPLLSDHVEALSVLLPSLIPLETDLKREPYSRPPQAPSQTPSQTS